METLSANISLNFVPQSVNLLIGSNQTVNLTSSIPLVEDAWLNFTYETSGGGEIQAPSLIAPLSSLFFPANFTFVTFVLSAIHGGHMFVGVSSNSSQFESLSNTYLSLNTFHVTWLDTLSDVIGWIYFVAWTVSFWPQVILNFYRKSVVGLNFDFLTYNIIGFSCYTVYNCVLYFSPVVQKQYLDANPRGGLPVTLQDVCFAIHAVAVILLTIVQTLIFERGAQRVSWVCRVISSVAIVFIIVSVSIGAADVITWLLAIKFLSYVKLGSTLIKYIPQAYMNFRRKSTVGWSIWNVLLDFTGGITSLLQMIILAYNYDDWVSIMGNPTKFALGAFSVLFDVLFIVQHYCLYYNVVDDARLSTGIDSQSFSDENNSSFFAQIFSRCCPGSSCNAESGVEPPLVPHDSRASFTSNTFSQAVTDENAGPTENKQLAVNH